MSGPRLLRRRRKERDQKHVRQSDVGTMAPRDRGNGRSREGLKINLRSRLHKWPALGQLIGHEAPAGEACVPCARGNGPFDSCRIVSCLVRVSSGPWRVIVVSIRAPRTNVLSVSFFRARTCPFGNIDLEFTFFSREVLQIGIADMEGNNVLDYFPRYSERVVASSSLPFLHSQLGSKRHRNKGQSLFYARWDSGCKGCGCKTSRSAF